MKNLLNKNISIYEFNILNDKDLIDFEIFMSDFDNYDEDEFIELIYGKHGLLEQKIFKIYVVVDCGAKEILSISPK